MALVCIVNVYADAVSSPLVPRCWGLVTATVLPSVTVAVGYGHYTGGHGCSENSVGHQVPGGCWWLLVSHPPNLLSLQPPTQNMTLGPGALSQSGSSQGLHPPGSLSDAVSTGLPPASLMQGQIGNGEQVCRGTFWYQGP